MEKFGFDPVGHAGKALVHALTALPHDLLISFSSKDLEHVALNSMSLSDRPRPRMVLVESPLSQHLFEFVWLHRDDVSTGRRVVIEEWLVRAANAQLLSWSIAMEAREVAIIRYALALITDARWHESWKKTV